MCGIIGGYGGIDSESASRMLACVVHRGPDDEGRIEVAGNVLGHRRLSIVDVAGGKQPLFTPDGNLYLVGNGEVYNHEEIRETLEDGDMSTRSNNEVALRLISVFLERVSGPVCGGPGGSLVLSRDSTEGSRAWRSSSSAQRLRAG
jgi:asparagine synthase (glutamine-hydrolysing)